MICDGQSGTAIGYFPRNSVLNCQYHSAKSLYTRLSLHWSLYQEYERAKPGSPGVNSAHFWGGA